MSKRLINPQWPFDIRRLPFFYGWVILLLSTAGFLLSVPGQTMGMAVFTDSLINALGLSRTQLSMAYLVGTVASALFLTRAGIWYDRFGPRVMIPLSSVMLAVMVLFISAVDWIAAAFGGSNAVSFLCIALGYFGVRFWGQGVLTSASRNALLLWFEKRRGLVGGVRGVFVSLGFSLAPLLLAWMITIMGWRGALWFMALFIGLGFSLVALLLLRNSPEDCGVLADGRKPEPAGQASVEPDHKPASYSLVRARTSPMFWLVSLSLSIHALFGTAITFHIVSIFELAGRDSTQAFGYFLPSAIVSTTVNLLASWQADKRPLKPFLVAMLCFFIVGGCGLLQLDKGWGYWLLVVGMGGGGGLWGVISNLAFIRYFGPGNVGAISGLCTSVMVFASAIGPALFSLGLDVSGSYAAPQLLCIAVITVLLMATFCIHQQELS